MKRFLAILTAAALCLGLVPAALGDAVMEQAYTFTAEDADFIPGTNMFEVGGYDGRALAALDGTLLTEPVYRAISFVNGYFTASLAGKDSSSGVLGADGKVLVPFEYDDIQTLSEVWAAGIRLSMNGTKEEHDYTVFVFGGETQYALVDTVDLYNVAEGKLMATLTRDQYLVAYASGEILNVMSRDTETVEQYDGAFQLLGNPRSVYTFPDEEAPEYSTFYQDGKYGVKDAQGNVVVEPVFEYIYDIRYGLLRIKEGDLFGLADLTGKILVPAEFSDIPYFYGSTPTTFEASSSPYSVFGFAAVDKDKKIGYYNLATGAMTAEPLYGSEEKANNYGVSQLRQAEDGTYYIYAADGTDTPLAGYSYCSHLDYSLGRYYVVTDSETGKDGLVDWHGNIVLPCEYGDIELSADARYLMTYDDESRTVTVLTLTDGFGADH